MDRDWLQVHNISHTSTYGGMCEKNVEEKKETTINKKKQQSKVIYDFDCICLLFVHHLLWIWDGAQFGKGAVTHFPAPG